MGGLTGGLGSLGDYLGSLGTGVSDVGSGAIDVGLGGLLDFNPITAIPGLLLQGLELGGVIPDPISTIISAIQGLPANVKPDVFGSTLAGSQDPLESALGKFILSSQAKAGTDSGLLSQSGQGAFNINTVTGILEALTGQNVGNIDPKTGKIVLSSQGGGGASQGITENLNPASYYLNALGEGAQGAGFTPQQIDSPEALKIIEQVTNSGDVGTGQKLGPLKVQELLPKVIQALINAGIRPQGNVSVTPPILPKGPGNQNCPSGTTYNPNTGNCDTTPVKPPGSQNCPSGTTWNPATQNCDKNPTQGGCGPSDPTWNPVTGKCDSNCNPTSPNWNPQTGTCLTTPGSQGCKPGDPNYNSATGKCDQPPPPSKGSKCDPSTDPNHCCPPGTTWNPGTQACGGVPPGDCGPGKIAMPDGSCCPVADYDPINHACGSQGRGKDNCNPTSPNWNPVTQDCTPSNQGCNPSSPNWNPQTQDCTPPQQGCNPSSPNWNPATETCTPSTNKCPPNTVPMPDGTCCPQGQYDATNGTCKGPPTKPKLPVPIVVPRLPGGSNNYNFPAVGIPPSGAAAGFGYSPIAAPTPLNFG